MAKKKQEKIGIMLYFDNMELHKKLEEEAKKEMRSMTNMVNYILAQYFEDKEE